MSEKEKKSRRATKYVVLPVESVRMLNVRSDEEVIDAQRNVDDKMLAALEEMINAARAGKLESVAALAQGAAAW